MAALVAIVLVALFMSLSFAFAAPWLVIVPILIVLLFLAWLGTLAASRRTPEEAIRRTRKPRLLGPGGPDDPDA